MSKAKSVETNLQTKEEFKKIPLDNLKNFDKNTFKKYEGKKLDELVESIKECGILEPILVRPIAGTSDYEIICGHNRVNAAKKAELKVIPAMIREMDDDEAVICMAESNFKNRTKILPSERGHTYKVQLEAFKRQGKRTDLIDYLTSCQLGTKLEAGEKVARDNEASKRQIHRYIRLTYLITDFLDAVDDGKLKLNPAVNISYLDKNEQEILNEILTEKKIKLTLVKSEKLRDYKKSNDLTEDTILKILDIRKENSKEEIIINKCQSMFAKDFKGYNEDEMQNMIQEALKRYLDNIKNNT